MKKAALLLVLFASNVHASYLFDASGEYIYSDAGMASLSQPITLSCWVKLTDWGTGVDVFMGIGNVGGTVATSFQIYKSATDEAAAASIDSSSIPSLGNVGFTANMYDGVWVNVTGTFTSNTLREVSIDGSATQGSDTSSRTVGAALNVIIGNDMAGAANIANGLVAECGIWDVTLSDTDIDLLDGGLEPGCVDTTNLVGYWSLATSQSSHSDEGPNGGPAMVVEMATFDADHPSMTGCGGGGGGTAVLRRRWQ